MSENDRTRRTPEPRADESAERAGGHGIEDVGARQRESEAPPPEREDTEIRRTQRRGSESRDETPVGRTTRDRSDTGSRTNLPGNTSETGAGTPDVGSPGRAQRPGSGMPPIGCARTAGSLMLMAVALSATITRLLRK